MALTFTDWQTWTNDEGITSYPLDWSSPAAMQGYPPRPIVEVLRQALAERENAVSSASSPSSISQNTPLFLSGYSINDYCSVLAQSIVALVPSFINRNHNGGDWSDYRAKKPFSAGDWKPSSDFPGLFYFDGSLSEVPRHMAINSSISAEGVGAYGLGRGNMYSEEGLQELQFDYDGNWLYIRYIEGQDPRDALPFDPFVSEIDYLDCPDWLNCGGVFYFQPMPGWTGKTLAEHLGFSPYSVLGGATKCKIKAVDTSTTPAEIEMQGRVRAYGNVIDFWNNSGEHCGWGHIRAVSYDWESDTTTMKTLNLIPSDAMYVIGGTGPTVRGPFTFMSAGEWAYRLHLILRELQWTAETLEPLDIEEDGKGNYQEKSCQGIMDRSYYSDATEEEREMLRRSQIWVTKSDGSFEKVYVGPEQDVPIDEDGNGLKVPGGDFVFLETLWDDTVAFFGHTAEWRYRNNPEIYMSNGTHSGCGVFFAFVKSGRSRNSGITFYRRPYLGKTQKKAVDCHIIVYTAVNAYGYWYDTELVKERWHGPPHSLLTDNVCPERLKLEEDITVAAGDQEIITADVMNNMSFDSTVQPIPNMWYVHNDVFGEHMAQYHYRVTYTHYVVAKHNFTFQ